MKISEIQIYNDFNNGEISNHWNNLVSASKRPIIFQRIEWLKNWWINFSGNKRLLIFSIREHQEPIGIIPLMIKNSLGIENVSLIGDKLYDYFDFIVKKNREKDAIDNFIEFLRKQKVTTLDLKSIPGYSEVYSILKKKIENGQLKGKIQRTDLVPFVRISGGFDDFWKTLKKSLRDDLKRQKKRLETQAGNLEFGLCKSDKEILKMLNTLFRFHIKRWESYGGHSVFRFKPYRDFYISLVKDLFEKGMVNIFYLSCSERIVACCFCFIFNNSLIYYTPAYNPTFSDYSPGKLLIEELIKFCYQNKFEKFDFGIGQEEYKRWWATDALPTYNLNLYLNNNNAKYFLVRGLKEMSNLYNIRVKPKLRKNKLIYGFWHWIKRSKGDVHFKV